MPAGRSLAEWTARSTSPSRSARTISVTNRPFTPAGSLAGSAPRSPAVVIATSSVSTPNAVSALATSRAWASASREPRVPMRSFTRWGARAEQLGEGSRVCVLRPGPRGLLQPHDRLVEQLGDDTAREGRDRLALLRLEPARSDRKRSSSASTAASPRSRRARKRTEALRSAADREPPHLVGDDRMRALDVGRGLGGPDGDRRAQAVDVDQGDAAQSAGGGFDVPRDGEVDHEHRPLSVFHRVAHEGLGEDDTGGAGRRDRDVGLGERAGQLREVAGLCRRPFGQGRARSSDRFSTRTVATPRRRRCLTASADICPAPITTACRPSRRRAPRRRGRPRPPRTRPGPRRPRSRIARGARC